MEEFTPKKHHHIILIVEKQRSWSVVLVVVAVVVVLLCVRRRRAGRFGRATTHISPHTPEPQHLSAMMLPPSFTNKNPLLF